MLSTNPDVAVMFSVLTSRVREPSDRVAKPELDASYDLGQAHPATSAHPRSPSAATWKSYRVTHLGYTDVLETVVGPHIFLELAVERLVNYCYRAFRYSFSASASFVANRCRPSSVRHGLSTACRHKADPESRSIPSL